MSSIEPSRRAALARLAALAGAAASMPRAFAASAVLPERVRVGYQKGSATLVLAKRRGTLEARLQQLGVNRVEWVEFQFGPPMLEAIGAGAVDLGSVGDTPPIFAQAGGAGVVYAAATPATEHAILVPEHSDIKRPADLRGKRLAVAKGSSAHNVTLRALALAGLSFKDIQPIYLAPADASAAFVGGKVDAWTVWDPFFAQAESLYKARVVVDTVHEPRLGSHAFYIAGRGFAEKHPETLQAVLDGLGELERYSASHRDEVAALAAELTGIDLEVQKRVYARKQLNLGAVTDAVLAQQQQIADAFYREKLIPKPIQVREIAWRPPGA